jgi:hypothetical protein
MAVLIGPRGVRAALLALTIGAGSFVDCYSTGDGLAPPREALYFPVGLQVSHGGSVLYVVNSDFDLQFSGGTIQSYDLRLIRRHTLLTIEDPTNPNLKLLRPGDTRINPCPSEPPVYKEDGSGTRQPLGETCAPPVDSTFFVRRSAVIGAFATDMQLSALPQKLSPNTPKVAGQADPPAVDFGIDRLFVPLRGNASLLWADVSRDSADSVPPDDRNAPYAPFDIGCGIDGSGRCDAGHSAGANASEEGNTRGLTMPGEPFGMAISEDGESIVLTHQTETRASLFRTGLSRTQPPKTPAIQYILDGVPFGGVGVAAIPHDRDAYIACPAGATGCTRVLPRPAFLETTRVAPEVQLLRHYADESGGVPSSLSRPFLTREAGFPITVSAGGSDSRGIAIDPTPRIACKARVKPVDPGANRTRDDVDRDVAACARKPARVFIANRTPAALLVGDIGAVDGVDGAYDADRLTIHSSVPLSTGPSKVFLAPVVDPDGAYALRVFVVCFDSATVFVYDPDAATVETSFRTGSGPFAMAFDPFDMEDVATHKQVAFDDVREPGKGLRKYRFAYLASFTNSFIQVVDLDNARPDKSTYERIVFTLGAPTLPKGSE